MAKSSSKATWLSGIIACAAVVSPALSASPQSNEKPAAAQPKVSPYVVALERQRAQKPQDAHAPAKPTSMSVGRPPKLPGRGQKH